MALRICHLGKFYPPATGGVEAHVQALARGQAALGARVEVVCVNHALDDGTDVTWRAMGRTRRRVEADGDVRVVRVGRQVSLARFDVCDGLVRELRRVRDERFDIIHVHAPNPTMFAALACMSPFGTLVVTHHSDVVKQRVLRLAFTPLERWIHGRAAMLLSTSEPYIRGSPALLAAATKVRALPLGIDLAPFTAPTPRARAYAEELARTHGKPLYLAVGRLVYYKGLFTAIDALAHVPGKLVVVGRGPLEGELHEHALQRGVRDRIVWCRYLDGEELVGAYLAATAFWFPSNARSEGFGLVQVEAMATGCPVINTAVPDSGVSWVSLDGVSGLTVPVGDPAALAAATSRLLDEPGLRERLSRGAGARARAEFDDRVMAERSLRLYAEAREMSATKTRSGPAPRGDGVAPHS